MALCIVYMHICISSRTFLYYAFVLCVIYLSVWLQDTNKTDLLTNRELSAGYYLFIHDVQKKKLFHFIFGYPEPHLKSI